MQYMYQWCAVYTDDSTLREQDAAHGFAGVDQQRVKCVSLLNAAGESEHSVAIPSGAEAVCFRRQNITLNLMDESSQQAEPIHCIGWRQGESAVYLFIGSGGATLLTSDLQAV